MTFIFRLIQADKNNAEADRINMKALERSAAAEAKVRQEETDTRMSLEKLANRKKGILQTSMNDFLRIYAQIKKIDFQKGDGILELEWSDLPATFTDELRSMTAVAGMTMTDSQSISVFLLGGISGYIRKEAELNLNVATMRRRQASLMESQAETITVALGAVKQRADRVSQLLTRLNILFRKSMEVSEEIIAARSADRTRFSHADLERLMTCVNLAKTIKAILDSKLIDEKGELTAQSLEAVDVGNAYLEQMSRATS